MPVRPILLHRPSFLFDCSVKIWLTCKHFLCKWFTAPPPRQKIARMPMPATKIRIIWDKYFHRLLIRSTIVSSRFSFVDTINSSLPYSEIELYVSIIFFSSFGSNVCYMYFNVQYISVFFYCCTLLPT